MLSAVKILFIGVVSLLQNIENRGDSLHLLLPAEEELNGLTLREVRYFSEPELSDFSPEMVKIYSEYGLIGLVTADYLFSSQTGIYAEIFYMADNGGAYGLFSVNRMTGGSQAGYGDESYQSERCIDFWKGNYYIRVYSYDPGMEVSDVICRIASLIDQRIKGEGILPEIIEFMPEEGFVMERTRYFRGSAGLSSELPFGFDDISGFVEGVYSDFGTYELIVLKYDNLESREDWYEKITARLPNNKRYREVESDEPYEIFEDKDGKSLVFGSTGQYIMVFAGSDLTRQPEIFERIEDAMTFQEPGTEQYP